MGKLLRIEDLGKFGIIKDPKPHRLPVEAFSDGNNMRFFEGKAKKISGWSSVIASTAFKPYGLFHMKTGQTNYWVYTGLADVRAFNDVLTEAEITRVSGDYTGSIQNRWVGTEFNDQLILCNGVDNPQLWVPTSVSTKLVDLTNWPASTTAKILRAFLNFLVALDITDGGTRYPHRVRWSHSAASGVPSSWSTTDATKDSGVVDLGDAADILVDALPLGNALIIYKENTTWLMRFVGGALKMAVQNLFRDSGLLAPDCAVQLANKHFAVTRTDCVVHDGVRWESVIDGKNRRYFFDNTDPLSASIAFAAHIQRFNEIWICAPRFGLGVVSEVMIWNYKYNTWSFRDFGGVRGAAFALPAVTTVGDTWDWESTETWASETALAWDEPSYLALEEQARFADADGSKILEVNLADDAFQQVSTNYRSFVERKGIALVDTDRLGMPVSDVGRVKIMTGVWPRIDAASGTAISIYTHGIMDEEGTPTWNGPYTFTVGTDDHVNVLETGRFFGVRVEATGSVAWALHSLALEIAPLGLH